MPRCFLVGLLPAAHIDQAFPVMQALRPGFTLIQWRALAASFTTADERRGIIACRMGTGHIRGLFCYAIDPKRRLAIGPFAVAGLFDADATADALIEAAAQMAWRLGADSIRVGRDTLVATAVPPCDLPKRFARHGFRTEGPMLVGDVGDIGEGADRSPVSAHA